MAPWCSCFPLDMLAPPMASRVPAPSAFTHTIRLDHSAWHFRPSVLCRRTYHSQCRDRSLIHWTPFLLLEPRPGFLLTCTRAGLREWTHWPEPLVDGSPVPCKVTRPLALSPGHLLLLGRRACSLFYPKTWPATLSYFPAPGEKTAGEKAGGLSSQNIPNRAAGI